MIIYFTFSNQGNKPYGLLINHLSSEDLYVGTIIDSSFSVYGDTIEKHSLKNLMEKFLIKNGGVNNICIQTQPLIGDADFKTELIEILELLKK